jgi:hypothetical protein
VRRRARVLLSDPGLLLAEKALLLRQRWTDELVSISGGDSHQPLHLGLVGRRLRGAASSHGMSRIRDHVVRSVEDELS